MRPLPHRGWLVSPALPVRSFSGIESSKALNNKIGITSAILEGLIRMEMKPYELCLDLIEIKVQGSGDEWRACMDRQTARDHPDCFAALVRAVLSLKKQFYLEE